MSGSGSSWTAGSSSPAAGKSLRIIMSTDNVEQVVIIRIFGFLERWFTEIAVNTVDQIVRMVKNVSFSLKLAYYHIMISRTILCLNL